MTADSAETLEVSSGLSRPREKLIASREMGQGRRGVGRLGASDCFSSNEQVEATKKEDDYEL